jgi:predicted transposase YbfD/YdcC
VVVIAVMAVLAGASGPTAIAKWATIKAEFLLRVLELPNGIPCKDVFRRVLMALQPGAFQSCFVNWLQWLRAEAAEATGIDQPVLAIDGKTLRRSHDRRKALGALHSVSIWASEFGLSLGQVACEEKSNEITAIPELLRLVDIKGAIITIDAMGTQKAIAEQIVDSGADYVLALKGNQGTLHDAVIDYVDKQSQDDFAKAKARRHSTQETGHGRKETRSYIQMPVPDTLRELELWKGLQ